MLSARWFQIFLIACIGAGFYSVLNGGVTDEEWHLYLAAVVAILLVGGALRAQDILDWFKSKLPSKPEDPKP